MLLSRVQVLRSVHRLGCSQMDCSLLSVAFLGVNDRVCRVDDLAAAEELGGIKSFLAISDAYSNMGREMNLFGTAYPEKDLFRKPNNIVVLS